MLLFAVVAKRFSVIAEKDNQAPVVELVLLQPGNRRPSS